MPDRCWSLGMFRSTHATPSHAPTPCTFQKTRTMSKLLGFPLTWSTLFYFHGGFCIISSPPKNHIPRGVLRAGGEAYRLYCFNTGTWPVEVYFVDVRGPGARERWTFFRQKWIERGGLLKIGHPRCHDSGLQFVSKMNCDLSFFWGHPQCFIYSRILLKRLFQWKTSSAPFFGSSFSGWSTKGSRSQDEPLAIDQIWQMGPGFCSSCQLGPIKNPTKSTCCMLKSPYP